MIYIIIDRLYLVAVGGIADANLLWPCSNVLQPAPDCIQVHVLYQGGIHAAAKYCSNERNWKNVR